MMMQRTPQAPQAPAQQAPAPQPQAQAPGGQPQGQPMGQAPQAAPGPKPDNVVVEAVKTLGMWIAAQAEQGNPQAPAMQEALRALLSSIMSKTPAGPVAPQPQQPGAQTKPMPTGAQQPAPQGGRSNSQPTSNVRPIPVM